MKKNKNKQQRKRDRREKKEEFIENKNAIKTNEQPKTCCGKLYLNQKNIRNKKML